MVKDLHIKKIVIAIRTNTNLVVGVLASYGITITLDQFPVKEFYLLGFYAHYQVYDSVTNEQLTKYRHDLYGAIEVSPEVGGQDEMGDLGFYSLSSTLTMDHSRLKFEHNQVYDFFKSPVLINLNNELFIEPHCIVSNYVPVGNVVWLANYYLDVGFTLTK